MQSNPESKDSMCYYSEILGTGSALIIQLLTVLSIFLSIIFWVWIYRRENVDLRYYALPIILWIIFGTLDITITALGTVDNPLREGNPLARFIFVQS